MRRISIVLTSLCFALVSVFAQKPVASKTMALFQGRQPETFTLFGPAAAAKEEMRQYVDSAYTLSIRPEALDALQNADAGLIRLQLLDPLNIQLDLYRTNVFSSEAMITTSDGNVFTPNPDNQFYRGMIHGDPLSLAIVSVFESRIQILFANKEGNRRIQQTAGDQYLMFKDKDILLPKEVGCFVNDSNNHPHSEGIPGPAQRMTGNCVEVYVECDYKSYQDNGNSVPNTEEWVAELWNEVITLYENEDIPVAVSDILVFTSTDPYANLGNTSAMLNAFRAHIDTLTYDGRLAHLLSTRNLGGGIAYVDVLCSNSYQVAVSTSLSTNIVPFPVFSWSVECVTHEMGHNMGSPHTHACAWNGNSTAIDGCGPTAGYSEGCTAPLPESGTIMSYCHLVSGVGINFTNGFGPQPGDLIRNRYNNASCNTGTCSPPLCTSLTTPAPNSTGVDINQDLFWTSANGAEGYKLTIGTTPTNGSILNNVDVGLVTTYNPANSLPFNTIIYVKIVPYNVLGDAIGCTNQSFTTEANIAPSCTMLAFPLNGATGISVDAILTWTHSIGNQLGYKVSIGTTLNGTQIANLVDVGNVNTYNHPNSFPYATTLYVKITPYWSGGDITNCASESFTTIVPVTGDFCNTAISLPCGSSIAGTTIGALPDTGLPFCGAAIEAPGIWYTFVGDGTNAVIATCSQYNYDTQLNAYQGSCNNLTCVTGIDDFCYIGSLISFPTTAGTTYYILVQGWGGQQGTFTLTRTCYSGPFYCTASGREASTEWIQNVVFNADPNTSGSSSYSDYTDAPLTVSRGGSYSIQITPGFLQNARNEYYKVWIDLNHDGDFTDGGEQVFSAGPSTTSVSGTINIPVTATKAITRMRVSMRYNATPSSSCGTHEYGEVEDYALNIRCNLVTSTLDNAENGTLRNVSACADDGEDILFASTLNNQTINLSSTQLTVDGHWKWMAAAGSNIEIKANSIPRVLIIPAGMTAEIQNLIITGGTNTNGSAIDNLGTLTLRDTKLYRATGTNTALRNRGPLTVIGICDIRN
ncbi:MAG: GEVED domain-containing protein [Saprospiraceae bacterium]|nr:GEVED domain-containing protein [Saprospiraceae bacterium]